MRFWVTKAIPNSQGQFPRCLRSLRYSQAARLQRPAVHVLQQQPGVPVLGLRHAPELRLLLCVGLVHARAVPHAVRRARGHLRMRVQAFRLGFKLRFLHCVASTVLRSLRLVYVMARGPKVLLG